MSIVTLKRKTSQSYRIMSSGFRNFSLNGTLRSQGYVGQTSLSRSLPKTIYKGNVPCGHGGCCGTYKIAPIVQSAVTSMNDPKVIKSSVVGTYGMLETKYKWTKRPQPFAVVKPDATYINLNTEGDYISWLKKKTLAKLRSCNLTGITNLNTGTNTNKLVSKKSCCTPFCNEIFRSHLQPLRFKTLYQKINYDWGYLRKSYTDDYLVTLNDNCSTNLDVFFVPNKSYNYPAVSHF